MFQIKVPHPSYEEFEHSLTTYGGISFPLLTPVAQKELCTAAEKQSFEARPSTVGKVSQDLASCEKFSRDSLFMNLSDEIETLLNSSYGNLFKTPIAFNEHSLQVYPANSVGVTPHIDSVRCKNCIAIVMLQGDGNLYTCTDKTCISHTLIEAKPGDIVILRAAGFAQQDIQQVHTLRDIQKGRTSFGMRQVFPSGRVG